jgi:short-subunit dehydrogenase
MDYFFYLLFAFLYLYLYLRYRYYKAYPSKNILITGGTDGIGKAWVEKYAKNSCINKIYVVGRNIERLTELQTFILNKYNKNIHCIVCDLDNNINLDIFNVAKLDVDTIVYSAGVSYPMALLSENVDIELTNRPYTHPSQSHLSIDLDTY